MAAVLVDKLSGNGLLHDLLHLQDTQGWERLIGRGAAPQGLCCTPRVSPQAVWGVWVAPPPAPFPSTASWSQADLWLTATRCPFHFIGREVCHLFVTQNGLPCPQFPQLFLSHLQDGSFEGLTCSESISSPEYKSLCLALCLTHNVY